MTSGYTNANFECGCPRFTIRAFLPLAKGEERRSTRPREGRQRKLPRDTLLDPEEQQVEQQSDIERVLSPAASTGGDSDVRFERRLFFVWCLACIG